MLHKGKTDQFSFISILIVIACITLPIALKPDSAAVFIREIYQGIVSLFGSTYMVFGIATSVFLLVLAFSKYGKFVLGGKDATPEFGNFSWASMLFCSGIGGGILYWSGVEWAYYVNQPPFGLEPLSQDSYMLASAYGAFHWGISGWALYCLPTVVIAVPFYHYKLGSLRLSSGLRGLRGNQVENSILGRCIDLIFVIVAIGASGGSMGMYIPVISAGISELYGSRAQSNLGFICPLILHSLICPERLFRIEKRHSNVEQHQCCHGLGFLVIYPLTWAFQGNYCFEWRCNQTTHPKIWRDEHTWDR